MAALTAYAENKIIDALFRGQALGAPATFYAALVTVAGSAAVAGTEVSGGSYARQPIAGALANWAGTQGAGTTVASSGTGGATSNNNLITYPSPTANWGTVVGLELWDAVSGGNRWLFGLLSVPKIVSNGDPAPTFPAASMVAQLS